MKRILYILIFMQLVVVRLSVEAQTISIHLPDTTVTVDSQFEVPVYVDSTFTGQNVYSYQLQIEYPAYYLQVVSVSTIGCIAETFGEPTVNYAIADKITIAAAGVSALSGSGKLLYIKFKALQPNYWTNVSLVSANSYFNETHPTISYSPTYFHLEAASSIYVQTPANMLFNGETAQISTYYGQEPYTWSITNSNSASISSDGILKAIHAGFTKVVATDANGITDTSDVAIEIRDVKISIPDTSSLQGSVVSIPVFLNNLSSNDIYSGAFTVNYNSELFNYVNTLTSNTLLNGANFSINSATTGKVVVSFASATAIGTSGALLYLNFKLSDSNISSDYLRITDVLFNENVLAVNKDGYLSINSLPYIYIYPENGSLILGESAQLTLSGNYTAPLTWSVSDSSIASIDQNGVLTGLKSGNVTVKVIDSIGATNNSCHFSVYNSRVTMPDTAICATPQTFLYPIFIESKTSSENVFSAQGTVTFNESFMSFIGLETVGTLTQSWTYAANTTTNSLSFAGSGSSSFNTSGTLVYLKFQLNENFTEGSYSSIDLQNIILNEGSPTILNDVTGRISGVYIDLYTIEDQTICEGSTIELYAWGADTYLWQPAADLLENNTSVINVSPSTSTQYIVYGSIGSCTKVDSVFVTVNPLPKVSAGSNISVCAGDSFQLIATGDSGVIWSGFDNDTINIIPYYTDYYTALATNNCGTTSDTILVEILPTSWVSAGNDIQLCLGQSTVLQAFGEGFVSWIGFENDSINVSPTETSTYIATASNSCGTISDSVWVFVNASSPTVSAGIDQSICNGQSINLQAIGTGNVYWEGYSSNVIDVSPTLSTYYIAIAEDICGTNSDTLNVTVNPLPIFNLDSNQYVCYGNSVTIGITQQENHAYTWISEPYVELPQTSAIEVSPLTSTLYTLTVTDLATNCAASNSINITVNELPMVGLNDITVVGGDSTMLRTVINQYYSYLWTSIMPTGYQSAQPEPFVKPAISTQYMLHVINTLTQCSNTDSMWVYVTTKPRLGDVDYNGEIQAFDAAISLQYSVGLDPISSIDALPWSEWRVTSADVDGNKAVQANDASLILRYVVGLITSFPAQTASKSTELADVQVSYNSNNITISSLGGVYALNVSIDNAEQFGEPVFEQGNLTAFNTPDNVYSAALCSTYPIENKEVMLQIPVLNTLNGNVTVRCVVNNTSKDFILSPVGINTEKTASVSIYPNPASERIYISDNQLNISKIEIFASDGKKQLVSIHYADNKYEIDITQLPDGMYVMHVISKNGTSFFQKFIKQKR